MQHFRAVHRSGMNTEESHTRELGQRGRAGQARRGRDQAGDATQQRAVHRLDAAAEGFNLTLSRATL